LQLLRIKELRDELDTKRWPRLDTLMSVAEGLGITVDQLRKGLHKPFRR
jgi:hypothetical protein